MITKLDSPIRLDLRERLRRLLHHHNQFVNSDKLPDWLYDKGLLDRLARLYEALKPSDYVDANAWLFDYWPELPFDTGTDWGKEQSSLKAAQLVAANDLLTLGLPTILERLSSFKNPRVLGFTLALCEGGSALAEQLFTAYGEDESSIVQDFIQGFSAASYQREGNKFLEKWVIGQDDTLSEAACATVLLGLPSGTLVWDTVEGRGPDCAVTYWKRTTGLPHGNPAEGERAARSLFSVGRVLDAVRVLGTNASMEWLAGEGDVELACQALGQAIAPINADPDRAQQVSYCAATLLKNLSACGKLDGEAMAQLEWTYFGLLRYQAQHELVIYRRLAAEPSVLVDLLALLYVSDQVDKTALPEPSDAEKRVANNAWHVSIVGIHLRRSPQMLWSRPKNCLRMPTN
ncbi:hypothetical protein AWV79_27165 [Cupriavidus sp. UYMMa02A]|nr:hypothetical protein AWV79_27165 [Cupriavidus sp. UYMMa02A]